MGANRELESHILEIVNRRLDSSVPIEIKCVMIRILCYTSNKNSQIAEKNLCRLLNTDLVSMRDEKDIIPMLTLYGLHYLQRLHHINPAVAKSLNRLMFDSSVENIHITGIWMLLLDKLIKGEPFPVSDQLLIDETKYLCVLINVINEATNSIQDRNEICNILRKGFNSSDVLTRKTSGDFFNNIESKEMNKYRELIFDYIKSPAFSDGHGYTIKRIVEAMSKDYELLLLVSNKILSKDSQKDIPTHRMFYLLNDMIKSQYDESESYPERRKSVLDIIDRLLENGDYDAYHFAKSYDLTY